MIPHLYCLSIYRYLFEFKFVLKNGPAQQNKNSDVIYPREYKTTEDHPKFILLSTYSKVEGINKCLKDKARMLRVKDSNHYSMVFRILRDFDVKYFWVIKINIFMKSLIFKFQKVNARYNNTLKDFYGPGDTKIDRKYILASDSDYEGNSLIDTCLQFNTRSLTMLYTPASCNNELSVLCEFELNNPN